MVHGLNHIVCISQAPEVSISRWTAISLIHIAAESSDSLGTTTSCFRPFNTCHRQLHECFVALLVITLLLTLCKHMLKRIFGHSVV